MQAVQLFAVEVGSKARRLPGSQDAPSLVDVEDALFTEHVDVVDTQLTTVQSAADVRQLDTDDVIGSFLRRHTPASKNESRT